MTTHRRVLRSGLRALAIAAALLLTQTAFAAPNPGLTFTGFEFGSVNVALGTHSPLPAAIVSHDSAGAYNTQVNGGATFESFCIDVWQYLSFNHTYSLGNGADYTARASMVGAVTNAGTITQGTVDNLSRLYAEAHGSIVNNAVNSAALQLAIWEVVYETPNNYDLASGKFYSTPSAVTSVVNGWLSNLSSYSPNNYAVSGYVSNTYQDVIVFTAVSGPLDVPPVPLPEPGTYVMTLAGLALIAFVTRRRNSSS